jgi:RNA polymerase sigma factor (TIGR02999 family)
MVALVHGAPAWRTLHSSRPRASMGDPDPGELSALFERVAAGDEQAVKVLARTAHIEMRRIAAALLRRERPDHTIQPTALVNEAWLRLLGARASPTWEHRKAFFTGVATAMQRVLVDHARRRLRDKRGGGWVRQPFDPIAERLAAGEVNPADVLDLHAALEALARVSPRAAQVVELRIFSGLTIDETASVMDLSTGTIESEFKAARAWLREALERGARGP